jgi:hypothetical protein
MSIVSTRKLQRGRTRKGKKKGKQITSRKNKENL